MKAMEPAGGLRLFVCLICIRLIYVIRTVMQDVRPRASY